MKSKDYVDYIWHFKVEDGLDWEFCAGILRQDEAADVTPKALEKVFKSHFRECMGIEPYSCCPSCGGELLPRRSAYGYFIGCSEYPKCTFIATNKKPYKYEAVNNQE